MTKTGRQNLNKRAIAVFFMLFSFAVLPVSGLMLHNALADSSTRLIFISMALHNMAAIIFTVSTVFHIYYNWKQIFNYIKDKKDKLLKYPREMAIAGTTMAVLLLFVMIHVLHGHS